MEFSPPVNYSIFKDSQLIEQGLGDLFEQIKKGKVVYFPDSHYNVHGVDPSFPDFPVWIKAIGFTLNNKNGIPDRIVLMHENITERRNAEALLNDIIDKNPMSIQIVDKDGFTIRGNPAYIQLFGTLPPPNFSIFADLESKGPELEKLISLAKDGEIVHLPDIYFNAHDSVSEAPDIPLWIRALIFPLKDSGGKSQRFVFMHENITERKKSEQEIIAAKQKAEESEEKYKQIFDNTFDIMSIYEVTEDGRFKVLTFNAAEAKLIGPIEYYQNKYVDDCIPPHLYAQFKRNYERCIKEEKLIVYEEDVSFQEINKTFNTQLIPLKNNEGRIHRIIVISRDITENKLLQTQLIDQNEKLKLLNTDLTISKERAEESDRLKTAFLQNMSHEIRTPMNAIMGFSSLLVKNYNNKLKLEKFSTIINQRCNDLLDIINDILDISKIESGQLPVNMEECNLSELFAELLNFFYEYQNRIGKQHINFNLQAHCRQLDTIIVTDKGKLKQIFINLISNAFKFTESGTIEGGCKYDTNHNLVFYLTDTGIGIPPDKQKIVFERFAQLHQGNMQNIGGTGLGLSIVKGLVSLLGGEISLESEPNKGSSFSFTFPYKTSHTLQAETLVADASIHNNILHKTILIVEDDQYNAEYLKEILSDNGLNILLTDNGLDAIEICLSKAIDLVLMDIRLPDMNGYEVTKEIRKHKPHLKVIAQTAYAAQDEKQKAFDAGCCDYVSKPTRQDLLLSMLNKHLS